VPAEPLSVLETLFEPHPEYRRLQAGAHRRRVTPLGAPALIRHVAFWNPSQSQEAGGGTTQSRQFEPEPAAFAKRGRDADDAIVDLYRSLLAQSANADTYVSDVVTNSHVADGDRQALVLFTRVVDDDGNDLTEVPQGVAADSYRSIKISFFWHGLKTIFSFELHTEYLCLTVIIDASRRLPFTEIRRLGARPGPIFEKVRDKLKAFRDVGSASTKQCHAWHDFFYHVIWNSLAREALEPLARHSLGKKFIDFRGVVVGTDREEAEGRRIAPPFVREQSVRGTGERAPLCDPKSFDNLWKFVTCTQPKDTEFTLSRFLDKHAFYATALGSQLQSLSDRVPRPLYYLLYEDTLNPWQLGRLIYRVHRAGMARIAAIMHFEQLRTANQIVTEVESKLENVIFADSDEEGETENEEVRSRNKLRQKYEEAEARLADLSRLTLDGTLEYRIERSRYYVEQFFTVAKSLRIERVSGYQQYMEFVVQRLGPVFEYIDSLGRRYQRVQKDRALLLGRIQALDSYYQEQAVSRAQQIADFALSCVLIPYYVAAVLSHAVVGLFHPQLVWIGAAFFGLVMLLLIRLPRRYIPVLQARLWRRFATALVAAVILTFATDRLLEFPRQKAGATEDEEHRTDPQPRDSGEPAPGSPGAGKS
jgi:hypothetical protein